jgi:DNA-binding PadR family transcriptional regulator
MSAEATGAVWRYSPYTGAQLLVHLAIADVVNDTHGWEFWMSTEKLSQKARVSRSTVTQALADMVENGFLELLEAGGNRRRPSRYRFSTSALTGLASAASGLALARSPATNSIDNSNDETKRTSAVSGLVPEPARTPEQRRQALEAIRKARHQLPTRSHA